LPPLFRNSARRKRFTDEDRGQIPEFEESWSDKLKKISGRN
jgi:hypothetical protein